MPKALWTLISLMGFTCLPADADPILGPPACDLVAEQVLHWSAINETITMRTTLIGAAGEAPQGETILIFEDGYSLSLGTGGKYIDDFDPANPASCYQHLEAATDSIVAGISPQKAITAEETQPFQTLAELDAALNSPIPCESPESWRTRLNCEARRLIAEAFAGQQDRYDRLVNIEAPVLTVPTSEYGEDYVVFDPESRTTINLYYSGC